jgi:hypothetical protein
MGLMTVKTAADTNAIKTLATTIPATAINEPATSTISGHLLKQLYGHLCDYPTKITMQFVQVGFLSLSNCFLFFEAPRSSSFSSLPAAN